MKIVVLDGYTLNPGDLSWAGIKALGACDIFDRSDTGEVVARLEGAQVALINKVTINRTTMERLPG